MAAAAPRPAAPDKFCANCEVFGWKQVEETALKKCSRCKVLWYCGRACQEEHWGKVHQRHCRYLADATKAKASLHTASCASCRQVVAIGEEITNPANPTYPCVNKLAPATASLGSPHPFPLAGVPGDRQETGLIVLSKLLAKDMLTGGPVRAVRLQELQSLLESCRSNIWAERKIYPEGHGGRLLGELRKVVVLVEEETLGHTYGVFCVVCCLLLGYAAVAIQHRLRSPLASVAADYHHLLHRAGEGEGRFLDIMDRVLELLGTELVPYTEVVKAVCDGSPERTCGFCGDAVTVKEVAVGQPVRVAQVSIVPTAAGLVSCTQPACAQRFKKLWVENGKWGAALGTADAHRCDHCYQAVPSKTIDRCSRCLKKRYCSQACLLQDTTKGHTSKKFCKTEGEEWKVKDSKAEMVEKKRQGNKQLLARCGESVQGDMKKMVKEFRDEL